MHDYFLYTFKVQILTKCAGKAISILDKMSPVTEIAHIPPLLHNILPNSVRNS